VAAVPDEPRVQELLDELMDQEATPEEVCGACPELLPVVRERWWQIRRARAELDALLPCGQTGSFPTPMPEDLPLPQIPGYQVEAVLGHGGMGVVFRARHLRLGRLVALKMALTGSYADSHERERFRREAEAVAPLHHPNVVQVYDVGDANGRPYFTMELMEGGSLTRKLAGAPQPPLQAAALLATLAGALQAAHEAGVVHRDLKPGNVLLTADGTPKVADFGLARRLDTDARLTLPGAVIGTPSYTAPEQARGDRSAIGPRTDVYALGAILYECLTGRPPFHAGTAAATLQQVVADEPVAPRRLNPSVPADLQTVCMKCLSKEPARRYDSAKELADDLGRFQGGEPIRARPVGTFERAWKWARRRPALAAVLLAAVPLTLIIAVNREQALRQAENDKLEITKQKDIAQANERAAIKREDAMKAAMDFVENRVFAAARPEGEAGGLGHAVTLRRALEAALPFVATSFPDQPIIEARLRLTLGESFSYLGDAKTAAEQCEAARTLYVRHLGPDDPDTLQSMNYLALSYADLGRFADALKLHEETLTRRKSTLGPDHPHTLRSMNNLANSYAAVGRLTDALKLREETLRLMEAKLGPDHPDTVGSMDNLAISYAALGRHADAVRLFKEALTLKRAMLGPDHPGTLKSMHNLAAGYAALGRHADALKLFEETLALRKAKIGLVHSDTLMSMNNLANSYAAVGRQADALKLREETLALRKANLGADHPDTLQSMTGLANSYQNFGRLTDALKLREEQLALRKAKLGPNHPDTLMSMYNLGVSYQTLGRHAEALELGEETLALRETKLGASHPDTLMSMWAVAESLSRLERGAKAVPIIDDCVQRATGKPVNPNLLPAVLNLRLRYFEKARDPIGCRQTAAMLERLNRVDGDSLYDAACMWAVAAAVLRAADASTAGAKQADAEAEQAMALLKKSVAAGYKDAAHMEKDTDLDGLRDRADFKKLSAELAAGPAKQK
jgi:tetratricopeptide (TPR) repeat protein